MVRDQKRSLAALILVREKLAIDLCNEIYMRKEEAYEIIDFAFQLSDKLPETYDQLKSDIKSYIITVSYTHLTLPTILRV